MSWEKLISLKSSDGVVLAVEEAVILESPALKDYMNENNISEEGSGIEIPVNFETLTKVISWCRRHAIARDAKVSVEEIQFERTDVEYDPLSLFHLIHAAHQLKIKSLMDLACQTYGDMINNNKFDDISQAFAEAAAGDLIFRNSTLCLSSIQGSKDRTESSSSREGPQGSIHGHTSNV